MRRHLRYLFILPLLALSLGLSGCDSTSPHEGGTFTVLLTDAPGDLSVAVVTIEEVYLQGAGGGHVLRDVPITVDLLTLQNEILELAEDVEVASGIYNQLRLRISGGYIEVEQEDGSTRIYASSPEYAESQNVTADGHLQMPSYAQSGLKINLPGGTINVDGDQHIVLLDFNVAQSFGQQAGASGQWVMTPVIHASDFTLTGSAEITLSLADNVELPEDVTLADFAAVLDRNGDDIRVDFEESGNEGVFSATFRFLNPGVYDVTVVAPEGIDFTTDRALPFTVSVVSAQATSEGVVIVTLEEEDV